MTAPETTDRISKAFRATWALTTAALVLAIFPFTPQPALDIKVLIIHLTAGLAGLALMRSPRAQPKGSPFLLSILALLLINLLAALCSSFPGHSLTEAARLAAMVLIYLAAARTFTSQAQIDRLLAVFCLAMAASSLYACAQRLGFDPFPWDQAHLHDEQYLYMPGTFGNPNVAGHALVPAIICALYLASRPRMRWALALVPLYLFHLGGTHHRAGFAALTAAAGLVALALLLGRFVRKPARATILTLATAALIALGTAALAATLIASGTKPSTAPWLPAAIPSTAPPG